MGTVHATIRIRAIEEDTLRQLLELLEMDSKRLTVEVFSTIEAPSETSSTKSTTIDHRSAQSRSKRTLRGPQVRGKIVA